MDRPEDPSRYSASRQNNIVTAYDEVGDFRGSAFEDRAAVGCPLTVICRVTPPLVGGTSEHAGQRPRWQEQAESTVASSEHPVNNNGSVFTNNCS